MREGSKHARGDGGETYQNEIGIIRGLQPKAKLVFTLSLAHRIRKTSERDTFVRAQSVQNTNANFVRRRIENLEGYRTFSKALSSSRCNQIERFSKGTVTRLCIVHFALSEKPRTHWPCEFCEQTKVRV